jgi:hypothetical protein
MSPARAPRPWYHWPVKLYDRLYRFVYGLDQPQAQVGAVLRLHVRPSRRTIRLADGTVIRRGDLIGIIHLNNERVSALHSADGPARDLGFEFRRQFYASLGEIAMQTAPGGPLAEVRAFTASTVYHRGLSLAGFEPAVGRERGSWIIGTYQRALRASLHPAAREGLRGWGARRAVQLWITAERLRSRFGPAARRQAAVKP